MASRQSPVGTGFADQLFRLQAPLVQSGERRNAENLSETVPASTR